MLNRHHVLTDLEAEKVDNDWARNSDIADGMIAKHDPGPQGRYWEVDEVMTMGGWMWRVRTVSDGRMRSRLFKRKDDAEAAIDQWEAEYNAKDAK